MAAELFGEIPQGDEVIPGQVRVVLDEYDPVLEVVYLDNVGYRLLVDPAARPHGACAPLVGGSVAYSGTGSPAER